MTPAEYFGLVALIALVAREAIFRWQQGRGHK